MLESRVADLLKFVRGRRTSRSCHIDEEECFRTTFARCFFPHFINQLESYKRSRSDLYTINFNIWCPERSFDVFLKKCISWAAQDTESQDKGQSAICDDHRNFSDELREAGLAQERRASVRFRLGATAAPFHVLGHADETAVPFRQSSRPWYVHAWKTDENVQLPFSDEYSAEALNSFTSVVHCRMIVGMVQVSYTRAKQSLSISGKYCEVQCSQSYLQSEFIPTKLSATRQSCSHKNCCSAPGPTLRVCRSRIKENILIKNIFT